MGLRHPNDVKLSLKIIGGFSFVVLLIGVLIGSNLVQFQKLRKLQELGGEKAVNAAAAQKGAGMAAGFLAESKKANQEFDQEIGRIITVSLILGGALPWRHFSWEYC